MAIADTLLSNRIGNPDIFGGLPLQLLGQQEEDIRPTHNVIGFSQKFVNFGPHLIMWADRRKLALETIQYLRQQDNLGPDTFESKIVELFGTTDVELSLIYAHVGSSGIQYRSLNCNEYTDASGVKFVVAGSGEAHFTYDFDAATEYPKHFTDNFFNNVITRMDHVTRFELYDNDPYKLAFGGAYFLIEPSGSGWNPVDVATFFFAGWAGDNYYMLPAVITTTSTPSFRLILNLSGECYVDVGAKEVSLAGFTLQAKNLLFLADLSLSEAEAEIHKQRINKDWEKGNFVSIPQVIVTHCHLHNENDYVVRARTIYNRVKPFPIIRAGGSFACPLPIELMQDVQDFFNSRNLQEHSNVRHDYPFR